MSYAGITEFHFEYLHAIDTPKDQCYTANNAWKMVYSHDENMNTVAGSLNVVTGGLRNGAEIKVWSPLYGLTNIQKSSIHSITNGEPEEEVYYL